MNIYSFVGLIMLMGIVKKNAISKSISLWKPSATRQIARRCDLRRMLDPFSSDQMTTMAAAAGWSSDGFGMGAARIAASVWEWRCRCDYAFSQLMTLLSHTRGVHSTWRSWWRSAKRHGDAANCDRRCRRD